MIFLYFSKKNLCVNQFNLIFKKIFNLSYVFDENFNSNDTTINYHLVKSFCSAHINWHNSKL